jgi:hypothetical protein
VEVVFAALLVLYPPKYRQYVLIRPAAIAQLSPVVEIRGVAADIDHAVH